MKLWSDRTKIRERLRDKDWLRWAVWLTLTIALLR